MFKLHIEGRRKFTEGYQLLYNHLQIYIIVFILFSFQNHINYIKSVQQCLLKPE